MNILFDEKMLEEYPEGNGGFPYRKAKLKLFSEEGMMVAVLLMGISIVGMKMLKRNKG